MLDFEKELDFFKPSLQTQHIEDRIDEEGIKDLFDIIKMFHLNTQTNLNSQTDYRQYGNRE